MSYKSVRCCLRLPAHPGAWREAGRPATQPLRSGVQISPSGRLSVTFQWCGIGALALLRGMASLCQRELA